MKLYESICELINEYKNLNWESWLYVNSNKWRKNPKDTKILVLEGDPEIELDINEEFDLPNTVVKYNMSNFFEAQTFQDIIDNQLQQNKNSTIDDYIYAINYYAEYDSFLVF